MSEKPKKRLVEKGRYAWLMAGRAMLLSAALLCSLFGAHRLLIITQNLERVLGPGHHRIGSAFVHALFRITVITAGLYLLAYCLWKKERTVERVAPITKRTISSLPSEESLVRASDLPPFQQQAELLRAAKHDQETPPEELLRASISGGSEG